MCGLLTFSEVCLLWQDVRDGVYCVSLRGFLCDTAVAGVVGVIVWPCRDTTDCNVSI